MRSTLIKTIFAGAIAAGALLLSGSAAQAAGTHHPFDGPGIGGHGFFGDRGFGHGGFLGDRFGFPGDDFGLFGDDFDDHCRDERPTVIVVTVKDQNRHHHKPGGTGNAAGAGHHKPSGTGTSNGGYGGNGNANGGYGSKG